MYELLLDPEAGSAFGTFEFDGTSRPPTPFLRLAGGSVVRDGNRGATVAAGPRRHPLPPVAKCPGHHDKLFSSVGVRLGHFRLGHSRDDSFYHFIDRHLRGVDDQ